MAEIIPVRTGEVVLELRDSHRLDLLFQWQGLGPLEERLFHSRPQSAGIDPRPTGSFLVVEKCRHATGHCAVVAGEQKPAGQHRLAFGAPPSGDQPQLFPRCRQHRKGVGVTGVTAIVVYNPQLAAELIGQENIGIQ